MFSVKKPHKPTTFLSALFQIIYSGEKKFERRRNSLIKGNNVLTPCQKKWWKSLSPLEQSEFFYLRVLQSLDSMDDLVFTNKEKEAASPLRKVNLGIE